MYLTIRQQLKHLSKAEYHTLRELCHTAKNLTNEALYTVRQYYFATGKYLPYTECYKLLRNSPNYKMLNSNMAQQILKEVDGSFKSFFGLLKKAKEGDRYCTGCSLPHYLPKDGFATLVIGFVRINGTELILPYSNSFRKTHAPISVRIPSVLKDKKIREIRIIPQMDARFFEIQYTYAAEDCIVRNLNKNHVLALDLGVSNLITAASSDGKTFIIDGKRLKSINQRYNRKNARLQGIKDK